MDLKKPATQKLIDACFDKLNSVYGQYKFSNEQWCEMIKLSPGSTQEICDIERIALADLTYGNLLRYYELHRSLWQSFHNRSNSLVDRLSKMKKGE